MDWRNKKVLVTGADGFIGSHLVEGLIAKGAAVRAFTCYNSFNSWGWLDHFPKDKLEEIEVFSGDIRDPHGVVKAMEGIDVAFHLAALIAIPFSYHSPDAYVDTNVKGTLNVLQAARAAKIERVIHTSTSEIYGTAQYVPIDEAHPSNPQSPYAATKMAADHLALSFYRSFGTPVTVLRPFNTFGPRQSARAIIPTVITQILSGKTTLELGNVEVVRDFNYVGNLVEAFLRIAEEPKAEGGVYNAGSGRGVTIKEVIEKIAEITGVGGDIKITTDPNRLRPVKSEVERLVCDASLFENLCGWKPAVSLEQGLEETCRWFKENLGSYKAGIYNV